MPEPGQNLPEEAGQLACLGEYRSAGEAHQRGLVVLSQGEPYWLNEREDRSVELMVKQSSARWLQRQVDLYERESVGWPPPRPEFPDDRPGGPAALVWLVTMILAYLTQSRWPGLMDWGMLISERVQSGEAYRTFTALFLHANLGHLAGNLLFGSVFMYLVARHSGNALALLVVVLSGVLGNLLNAWIQFGEVHNSIGASTAVFGSIGILVTMRTGYVLRHFRQGVFKAWILPLVVGWIMLAWFGTGSESTDTTAHLFGFACGLPLGFGLGLLRSSEVN